MSSFFYSSDSCYGCSDKHLVMLDEQVGIHADTIEAWSTLRAAAKQAGFDLAIASAYRSFERQSLIWNAKLRGERPVLDEQGCVVDIACLPPLERIKRVLRWSALPGASRHHWGSDMDIYDRAALTGDEVLQLVPEEYLDEGPFAPMMAWLHKYLSEHPELEFYFPYQQDRGGVMPEPWHLSFRPVAQRFQSLWRLSDFAAYITSSNLEEKTTLLDNLDNLHDNFIRSSINPEVPV